MYPNQPKTTRSSAYLLWPESTSISRVLQIVSDDVGLLEEQAHGVGQLGVPAHLGVLQLGRGEQSRQADAHQSSHIMAILHTGEPDTE